MPAQSPQPANASAMMQGKLEALTQQLSKLNDFLTQLQADDAGVPKILRTQQQQGLEGITPTLFGTGPNEPTVTPANAIIQPPEPPPENFGERMTLLGQEYQSRVGKGGGRVKSALGALGTFAPPPKSPTGDTPNTGASLPPNASGGGSGGPGLLGHLSNPVNSSNTSGLGLNDEQAVTWALLGEHGGPAAIRNMALESYGIQRSLGWAQNTSGQLSDYIQNNPDSMVASIPGLNSQNLGAVQGALGIAKASPLATYLGYKGAQGVGHTIGSINAHLGTDQTIGQLLGYGPPSVGGQSIFGLRNPFGSTSTASQVGLGFDVEKEALQGRIPGQGFGNGLSGSQATQTLDVLANQGFSMQPLGSGSSPLTDTTGDAATIAQNFFRPLMEQLPGLSAQDLGQFTPSLRNSGTSVQQLTDQLTNLGVEARAAKETVGEFSSSIAQTGQVFESMGSSPQGGYAIGTGFTNSTGIDPQVAGQLAQNPLMQGYLTSQYGILPSSIGDMSSGAFTGSSMNMLKMMQGALSGLDQNKYKTVNGQRVLIQSGQQAENDQIAQMTGLPSNIVKRMLGDQSGITARANAQQMLGDPTSGTGFYQYLDAHKGKLDKSQYAYASKMWNDTVANTWQGTGIGQKQMKQIDSIKGLRDRAKAYSGALANASKNDAWDQIQGGPNSQTVQVQFTGLAAKIFQQAGPSVDKQLNNAGLTSIGSSTNSTLGFTMPNSGPNPFAPGNNSNLLG